MKSANQLWGWRTHSPKRCTHTCLQSCFSALWNHSQCIPTGRKVQGSWEQERRGGLLTQWHWGCWWNKSSHSSKWTTIFLLLFLTNNTMTSLGRWSKPTPHAIPWLESNLPLLVQLTSPSTTTGAPGEGRGTRVHIALQPRSPGSTARVPSKQTPPFIAN